MSTRAAKILLAFVILTRSCAFIFSKISLQELAPFMVLGIRFTISCLILSLIFCRHLYRELKADSQLLPKSFLLGLTLFFVMGCERMSLRASAVHMVACWENTAVAFVPIRNAIIYRRLPDRHIVIGVLAILTGVGFLTLGGASLSFAAGDLFAIGSGLFYGAYIVATGITVEHSDAFSLGILQMGMMGLLSLGAAAFQGVVALPTHTPTLLSLTVLILMCSCFGFTFQPVAQQYVPSDAAGMFCAITPLAASILGTLVFQETFGTNGFIGAACILAGMLYVNWPRKEKTLQVSEAHS